MAKMLKETLDDVQCKALHIVQSSFPSVLYNIVELVIWDLFRGEVLGETLNAHIAKLFATDEVTAKLLKRLFYSTFFMAPIANFVKRKMNTAMKEKKYSATVAPKGPVNIVTTFEVDSASPPSKSDSEGEAMQTRILLNTAESVGTLCKEART